MKDVCYGVGLAAGLSLMLFGCFLALDGCCCRKPPKPCPAPCLPDGDNCCPPDDCCPQKGVKGAEGEGAGQLLRPWRRPRKPRAPAPAPSCSTESPLTYTYTDPDPELWKTVGRVAAEDKSVALRLTVDAEQKGDVFLQVFAGKVGNVEGPEDQRWVGTVSFFGSKRSKFALHLDGFLARRFSSPDFVFTFRARPVRDEDAKGSVVIHSVKVEGISVPLRGEALDVGVPGPNPPAPDGHDHGLGLGLIECACGGAACCVVAALAMLLLRYLNKENGVGEETEGQQPEPGKEGPKDDA